MRRSCLSLGLSILAGSATACSGLNVQETIRGADNFARIGAALTLLAAFISWRLRRTPALFVCLVSVILHPSWTISSISGDCGFTKINATLLLGIICGSTLFRDVLRRVRA